ncbi:YoaK family protein [Aedoeadaptatus coxii]|uniref:DUF1275 domain-containing protein n=1 Tax=Aedoeadaptatus coxii TaxID=755172 RepID=A0A134ALK3_9FIRM|nr:YoaK family protein [Peptoniphilus coxii]KXB68586.1 hypothetical protein HMPREF1863_00055 [Peptoniphilus coxii]
MTKHSESLLFATLLTLAGGLQDTYSYALRGHVFVNALTGNVVLLALSLVNGDFMQISHYLVQILAFALGVYLSARIVFSERHFFGIHWQPFILFGEVVTLFAVGFLPHNFDNLANFLMATCCGIQVNTFRKFKDINFATTMCVGNVRTIMHHLAGFHHTKKHEHRHRSRTVFYIVFVFFFGATIGSFFLPILGIRTIWISALFLLFAFILLHIEHRA